MINKCAAISKIRNPSCGFLRKPRLFIIGCSGSGRTT